MKDYLMEEIVMPFFGVVLDYWPFVAMLLFLIVLGLLVMIGSPSPAVE